jgi:hypothetical protein
MKYSGTNPTKQCGALHDKPTPSMRLLAGSLHGVDVYMAAAPITREQPPLGPSHPPPAAQELQKLGREHDVAVSLTFALLHPDEHALAVDIGSFQRDGLRDAQPGAVADGEDGAMLDTLYAVQKLQDLFRAQHDG